MENLLHPSHKQAEANIKTDRAEDQNECTLKLERSKQCNIGYTISYWLFVIARERQ